MENKEQISEEFAEKLLENTGNNEYWFGNIIRLWKEKGYIKQTREEEIRKKLNENYYNDLLGLKRYIYLQQQLIEILDNKLKGVI